MGPRPAAPTSGAPAGPRPPLCGGVRRPRPPHHHLLPLCCSAGAPRAPGETFSPLCGGVGPLGGPPSPLYGGVRPISGLSPPILTFSHASGRPSGLSLPSRTPGDRFPLTPSLWEASCAENGRGRSYDDDVAVDETRPGVFRDFSLIADLVSLISFGQKRELETAILQS